MGQKLENDLEELDNPIIQQLKNIVVNTYFLTEKAKIIDYASDESPDVPAHMPDIVTKPGIVGDISAILKFASKQKLPVTPRGGGTGLSGGCVPIHGGIVLSMERMNRILEIDKGNFVAVVEPGVTLAHLIEEVEKHGLYYPLYPGEKTATLGGNIATNAGGINAIKYGVTRHNVLGLGAVLPNGDIIHTGGKYVKSSSGYDLAQLLIGSEGTLAVITKIILKLTTKPVTREILFATFNNLQNAIDAVPDILALKIIPNGLEFIEKGIVDIVEKDLGCELPYHQYPAFLLVMAEGETADEIFEYFAKVEEVCKAHGAEQTLVPNSEHAKRQLLEARERFYYAIKKYNLETIIYGHASDGNVHLHPVQTGITKEEWSRVLPLFIKEIYDTGVSFGGIVSGEHDIGIEKKPYFEKEAEPSLLAAMKAIKKSFDPNNILNPGKIFDI